MTRFTLPGGDILVILSKEEWFALEAATDIAYEDIESVPPEYRELGTRVWDFFHVPPAVSPKFGRCQNCGIQWSANQVKWPPPDLDQRVAPGEIVPLGECPTCGALVTPVAEDDEPEVNDEPPPDVGPPGSGAIITEYIGNEPGVMEDDTRWGTSEEQGEQP